MRKIRTFFARQQRVVLDKLGGAKWRARPGTKQLDAARVFNLTYWNEQLEQEANEWLADIAERSALRTLEAIDRARTLKAIRDPALRAAFDVRDPRVRDFIRRRANQLAGNVNDTTYRRIQKAIALAEAEGLTINETASMIQAVFKEASRTRALTIARTELLSALNGSSLLAAERSGVASHKIWLTAGDHRVRDAHTLANGQRAMLNQPFIVGGEALQHPGDPAGSAANIINCRCTMIYQVDPPMRVERAR